MIVKQQDLVNIVEQLNTVLADVQKRLNDLEEKMKQLEPKKAVGAKRGS